MRSLWWRRNRLWLLALAPLALLAVAASSFRLVTLYLPWEWSRPTVAHTQTGTLRQQFLGFDDRHHRREVRVTALSTAATPVSGKVHPAPGATLWRTELEFTASPDQILNSCTIELVDAQGVRYGTRGGKVDDRGESSYVNLFETCVPEDAPGPTLEPFTGRLVPSPSERPGTWRAEYLVAMPSGVEPTAVRVGWDRPDYLVLQLP